MTTTTLPRPTSAAYVPPPGIGLFSAILTGAIVCLIAIGAQVTSTNAGMSVPDWPTSYGYNMFSFPIQRWVGGIYWEHVHRLAASTVGLLTVILAVWVGVKESRKFVRGLAFGAVGLVILQGVVGGLRVVWAYDDFGILHAALGQLFLVTVGLIALSYTHSWLHVPPQAERLPRQWQRGIHLVAGLIFLQLILGAVMRHQHAGLSIPDFPTAYGHWWPQVNRANIDSINFDRVLHGLMPTTLIQIHLQMTHRLMAVIIFIGIFISSLAILRCRQSPNALRDLASAWIILISLQIILGAATVLSGKNPIIATGHVVTGALLLLVGGCMAALVSRWRRSAKAASVS